jgi:hypothetical protein
MPSPYGGVGSEALPIYRGANVRMVMALLNPVYPSLILHEAVGQ